MNFPSPLPAVTRSAPPTSATATAEPGDLRDLLGELADRLEGRLVTPGDEDWDAARTAWNLAVDQRPVAVVVAASTADLVRTVEAARGAGLAVAAQGTGHNAGPLAEDHGLADAILLRTSELRGVEIDVEARVARVEPGVTWGEVVAAAAPYGLAALAGSAHDVGVVGYTLGGGLSWLARSHGLAANHVLSAEVVTADGRLRRIDAEHDDELFWAVRGGGGDFGIVAALEFRLYPIAEVVAGTLFYPIERTEQVLQAWREWTETVPDSVTSVGRVLRIPAMPDLPPFLAGHSFVAIELAAQEPPEQVDRLLAPLRALEPVIDTVHPQSPAELLQLHMDPPGPVPGFGDGMALAELTPETVRAFTAGVGPESGSALLSAEIRHLGGMVRPEAARQHAAARGLPFPGAAPGLEAAYLVYAVGIALPELGDALTVSLGRLLSAIEPWRAEIEYPNFAEHRCDPGRLYGDRLPRLQAVKHDVDPLGTIRSNHPVRR